jgi:ABC-2 type transport system permease protein
VRPTLVIGRMEVTRAVTDKSAFFWMLAFPIVYATFFGLIQFSGSSSASVGLCIEDRDGGFIAEGMKASLHQFADELVDSAALATYGRADRFILTEIDHGDSAPASCARVLTILPGFSDSLLQDQPVTLELAPGESGSPMAMLTAQVMIWRAVLENLANLVTARQDSNATAVEERFAELSERPKKVTVQSSFAGNVRQAPEGLTQTVPGTIVMMTLMVLLTHGTATLVAERKRGLLLHLSATPASRLGIIWGKLVGRLFIGGFQVVLLWLIALFVHHVLGVWIGYRLFEILPLLLVYAFTAAAIGLFVAAIAKGEDTGVGIGIVVTLVMAALGGCWWPLEIVPRAMQLAGHVFPTAWAMDGLHYLMSYDLALPAALPHMGILAVFGLIFSLAGARLLTVA